MFLRLTGEVVISNQRWGDVPPLKTFHHIPWNVTCMVTVMVGVHEVCLWKKNGSLFDSRDMREFSGEGGQGYHFWLARNILIFTKCNGTFNIAFSPHPHLSAVVDGSTLLCHRCHDGGQDALKGRGVHSAAVVGSAQDPGWVSWWKPQRLSGCELTWMMGQLEWRFFFLN